MPEVAIISLEKVTNKQERTNTCADSVNEMQAS